MKGQRNGIIGFKMRKRSENERKRRAEEIIGSNITKGRVRGRERASDGGRGGNETREGGKRKENKNGLRVRVRGDRRGAGKNARGIGSLFQVQQVLQRHGNKHGSGLGL